MKRPPKALSIIAATNKDKTPILEEIFLEQQLLHEHVSVCAIPTKNYLRAPRNKLGFVIVARSRV